MYKEQTLNSVSFNVRTTKTSRSNFVFIPRHHHMTKTKEWPD